MTRILIKLPPVLVDVSYEVEKLYEQLDRIMLRLATIINSTHTKEQVRFKAIELYRRCVETALKLLQDIRQEQEIAELQRQLDELEKQLAG